MSERLSQNKKIALSVVLVFMMSFMSMVMFLDEKSDKKISDAKTSILDLTAHQIGIPEGSLKFEDLVSKNIFAEEENPIFAIDPDGIIAYHNKAFCDLLSIECQEIEGKHFYDYVNSQDLPAIFSQNTKLFRDGGDAVNGIGPYRMGNGDKESIVMIGIMPLFSEDKKVSHLLLSAKDITDLVDNVMTEDEKEDKSPEKIERYYPLIKERKDNRSERLMVDSHST